VIYKNESKAFISLIFKGNLNYFNLKTTLFSNFYFTFGNAELNRWEEKVAHCPFH